MLREYAYLDRNRIEDFLSQLEGGVSDTTRQSRTKATAGASGGVNIGVAHLGANVAGPTISQEDLRRTTDVALFERLHAHLSKAKELKLVSDIGDVRWASLRQGTLLELEGTVVVSGVSKLAQTIGIFQDLAPLMGQSLEGAEGLGMVFGDDIGIRYLLDDVTAAYSTLSAESVRATLQDLEGECTALVRVRKILRKGRREPVRKVAGLKFGVAQLEELVQTMSDAPSELGFQLVSEDLIAVGPAAIVTTVAIYR